MSARALILAGYGLNCEEETLYGFEYAGLPGTIRHINDLIENPKELESIEILVIPGGFSYGDDTGSGNAFAQKMRLALMDHLLKFVERDTLTLGICNGCQILCNLGLVPGFSNKYGQRLVTATYNKPARYQCRWVDTKTPDTHNSAWFPAGTIMHTPVAHGEGRFMMDDNTLKLLHKNGQIALQYTTPDSTLANGEFPYNPNGSIDDIAAITDETGRILSIMPHPERGMFTWQRDNYFEQKDQANRKGHDLPERSEGLQIFENAARYFEIAQKKSA